VSLAVLWFDGEKHNLCLYSSYLLSIGTQACCSNDQTVEAGQCGSDQECSKCPLSNLPDQKTDHQKTDLTSSTSPTNVPSYTPTSSFPTFEPTTSIPTFEPTVWDTYTPTMTVS